LESTLPTFVATSSWRIWKQATHILFPAIGEKRLDLRRSSATAGGYWNKLYTSPSQQLERSGRICSDRQQQLENTGAVSPASIYCKWRIEYLSAPQCTR